MFETYSGHSDAIGPPHIVSFQLRAYQGKHSVTKVFDMQEEKVVAHLLAGAAFGELALMQVSYSQIYESPETFCSLCLSCLRP